jgi:hypothetical protein
MATIPTARTPNPAAAIALAVFALPGWSDFRRRRVR